MLTLVLADAHQGITSRALSLSPGLLLLCSGFQLVGPLLFGLFRRFGDGFLSPGFTLITHILYIDRYDYVYLKEYLIMIIIIYIVIYFPFLLFVLYWVYSLLSPSDHSLRLEMIALVNCFVVDFPPKSPVVTFLSFRTLKVAVSILSACSFNPILFNI